MAGQVVRGIHTRVTSRPSTRERFVPTPEERALIVNPGRRILARHVPVDDTITADTIDGALIATGLAAFTVRSIYELAPLPSLHLDEDKPKRPEGAARAEP